MAFREVLLWESMLSLKRRKLQEPQVSACNSFDMAHFTVLAKWLTIYQNEKKKVFRLGTFGWNWF